MTPIRQRILPAFCVLSLACGSFLSAEESFDSLVTKLADEQYTVREESTRALTKLCCEQPELLDDLAKVIFDPEEDIERVIRAEAVVAEAAYVERGVIGFALDLNLVVARLAAEGPAREAEIQRGWTLVEVAGKPVVGMKPSEIYAMIHETRPGTKLQMAFVDAQGERKIVLPTVAPRSTVRSGEDVEERKKECLERWMELKREEFAND
ncbi:MAG: PDZ domain-containing protein [Akkermansiaceae bacterium]|nr:PDZ domain-containing protein [Akkermansiaceae bacterium]